jgi:SPP1 family predicted phage head-tail adaptor
VIRMEIGALRQRITLERLSTFVNESGFETESWEEVGTVWAAVTNLHGREYFAAAAVQAENTVKFTIRYLKGMDCSMRISFTYPFICKILMASCKISLPSTRWVVRKPTWPVAA